MSLEVAYVRTVNEVRTLYGLHDAAIPAARADEIVHSVFQLFQKRIDQSILKEEFVRLLESGRDLPDCEYDGHHGDEEWEVDHRHLPSPQSLFSMDANNSLKYIM
jgi:hypothetical protein